MDTTFLQTITGPGAYLVDKPSGVTSHDVVSAIRKQTGIQRVGHAGTLDPLASGALIVLVGREWTKQQSIFLKLPKMYVCTAILGYVSPTLDSDGIMSPSVTWEEVSAISSDRLEKCLASFRGGYQQTVPAFSAVKLDGKKLYELARSSNTPATLPSRWVEIDRLEASSFDHDRANRQAFVTLEIECGSGTYIRSLVSDIGACLGVGATVTSLRRTWIGPYKLGSATLKLHD